MNPVLGQVILKSSEQLHITKGEKYLFINGEIIRNSTKFVEFSQKSTIMSR